MQSDTVVSLTLFLIIITLIFISLATPFSGSIILYVNNIREYFLTSLITQDVDVRSKVMNAKGVDNLQNNNKIEFGKTSSITNEVQNVNPGKKVTVTKTTVNVGEPLKQGYNYDPTNY